MFAFKYKGLDSSLYAFVTLWTIAHQAPLSVRFCRQEYWSGLPCPPPGDLLVPGMEPMVSCIAGGFFTAEPPGACSGCRKLVSKAPFHHHGALLGISWWRFSVSITPPSPSCLSSHVDSDLPSFSSLKNSICFFPS